MKLFYKSNNIDIVFIVLFGFCASAGYAQNKEIESASSFTGIAEITLKWNQLSPQPNPIAFTEVDTKTVIFEDGAAVAEADAVSAARPEVSPDTVKVFVDINGGTTGIKGLANASAIAHNYFTLENFSDQPLTVHFEWSAKWLLNGNINNPWTDRTDALLRLRLAKTPLLDKSDKTMRTAVAMVEDGVNQWPVKQVRGGRFKKKVVVSLPTKGNDLYKSNERANQFELVFEPNQAYIFALTLRAEGLATVREEGCSVKFWNKHRRQWPIHHSTKFSTIFGVGSEGKTLGQILRKSRKSEQIEAVLMGNAVAALLNIQSKEVSFHVDTKAGLVDLFNQAYESPDFEDVELLNSELSYFNSLGTPWVCKTTY
ncbi:MAG: hypothetical protein V3U75_04405 [Methylococcaceae bacterium]